MLLYLGMRPCKRRILGFCYPVLIIRTFLSFNGGIVHYTVNTPHSLNVWLGRDPAAKLLLVNISAYSFSATWFRFCRLFRPENKLFSIEYTCQFPADDIPHFPGVEPFIISLGKELQ